MSPPTAAENNQIILSGDTSSFRHSGDGANSPLLCLHLSVCSEAVSLSFLSIQTAVRHLEVRDPCCIYVC